MKNLRNHFFLLLVFLAVPFSSFAQSDEDKAVALTRAAVSEMDKGNIEKSLEYLEEAKKLDPDNMNIPYEMAYAYYLQKDYKKAEKILKKLTRHKDVNDRVFQMLGNTQDMHGNAKKAIKTYDKGLKKFPNSGALNLERGNMELAKKEYNKALNYYEAGIRGTPTFPSNYYWASKIYLSSTNEVWGMVYGEIFMNLEPSTARTSEISKMLYNTYKSEIEFSSDTSYSVSFCKSATIYLSVDDLLDTAKFSRMLMPFGTIYEQVLMTSIMGEEKINLSTLDKIRAKFVTTYFDGNHNVSYPNILFDYQKEVKTAGHLEAYNYWILSKGNDEEFSNWKKENGAKWDAFVDWFRKHDIGISQDNFFHSNQY